MYFGNGWNIQFSTQYSPTKFGILHVLNSKGLDVPYISNETDFKTFVDGIEIGQKRIALFRNQVFPEYQRRGTVGHVFAIVVEKRLSHSIMYSLDCDVIHLDYAFLQQFFSTPLTVYMANKRDNKYGSCSAYAIHDYELLASGVSPVAPTNVTTLTEFSLFKKSLDTSIPSGLITFQLSPPYMYNAEVAKQEYVTSLISKNELEGIEREVPAPQ